MANDDSRFVEIYKSHYRSIYAYLRRRLAADLVDDAVAETFLVAWRKVNLIPSGEQSLPWLYGVAHRVVMHQWRSSQRSGRLHERLNSLGVEAPTPPEELIISSLESRQVLEAASKLKATDQEILRLSIWEGLSHEDIASALDLETAAVRQRFSRALTHLTNEFNRLEKQKNQSPAAQKGGVW
jgi:RNA polymerase sigma-70 factor (ECF subfamily)